MAIKKQVRDTIETHVAAGKGDTPFVCYGERSREKQVSRLKKQLRASENFQVYKDTVWGHDGTSFKGIATWRMEVAVFVMGQEHRFRTLQIDRLGWRTYYAIPISMADSFSSLPGIALSSAEIGLIKEMANELSVKGSVPEEAIYVVHPAKPALVENRERWGGEELNLPELLQMMEDPVFRCIVIVVLAAHYRSFLHGTALPEGIFNFILPKKGNNVDSWFYSILQALTFVNAPGKNVAGPITITVKEAADLNGWRQCYERLAVIRTATGSFLWQLLEEIEESDRFLKSGGAITCPLPTVPISLTRSYLHHPQAVDIPLPNDPPQMTDKQRDMLRTAMSRLLRRKIAKGAFHTWNELRAAPTAYRTNGLSDWQDCLLDICLQTWFPGDKNQSVRKKLLSDTQHQREEQEHAIGETLQHSLALLTDPSRYRDEIIEQPSSKAEWSEAIEDGKLAFWFTPKSGNNKGTTILVFTSATLKSLIARTGCTEELYDAFIKRCVDTGIWNEDNKSVRLEPGNSGTIAAVSFFVEKP